MSIRWVLSLGIAALLGLMAIGQIGLIYWSKDRIEREIQQQSQELTKVVIHATTQQLANNAVPPVPSVPQVTPVPAPGNTKQQLQKLEIITSSNRPIDVQQLQQQMEQQLESIQQQAGQREFKLFRNNSGASSLIQSLFQSAILMILICALLAFVLALWLAHKFIAPLQQLIEGFRQLAAGRLGVQLPVQGLADYRYVQQQFNVTSQQLAEHASQAEQQQAQQHLIELGEISRGLVHALRNPLHTLALSIEQLAAQQPDTTTQQLALLAEQKVQHINRTLTALLTLSCGQIDRNQPVSLPTILQDLLLEFSSAPVQFDLSLPETVPLYGSEAELRSLIHAVLCNAIEASPVQGLVRIDVTVDDEHLWLRITDQGPGLTAQVAARLFQPHVSSKPEGAGMGLYICQRLLQRYYQGDVALVNNTAGGCAATIRLKRGDRQ